MSELLEKRLRFTRYLAGLIEMANSVPNHQVAIRRDFDEANESIRHMRGSLHYLGLAVDLDLYIGGVYATDSANYRHLGEWWKMQADDCKWGGSFRDKRGNPTPDGCHFSIEFKNRQ